MPLSKTLIANPILIFVLFFPRVIWTTAEFIYLLKISPTRRYIFKVSFVLNFAYFDFILSSDQRLGGLGGNGLVLRLTKLRYPVRIPVQVVSVLIILAFCMVGNVLYIISTSVSVEPTQANLFLMWGVDFCS